MFPWIQHSRGSFPMSWGRIVKISHPSSYSNGWIFGYDFLVLPRVFPGPLQGPQSPVNSAGLPDFRVPGRPWGLGRHLSALSGCFAAGRDMVQPMQGQLSEFESPLMKQTWTLPAAHPQDFALHSSSTASDPDAILLVVLLFLPDLSFPLPGRSLRFPPTGIPSHALHYSLPASASHPFCIILHRCLALCR